MTQDTGKDTENKDHSLPLSFREVEDLISIIYRHSGRLSLHLPLPGFKSVF